MEADVVYGKLTQMYIITYLMMHPRTVTYNI